MLSWLWTNYVPLHCNCVKFTIIGCDPVASTDTLVHANRPRLELHVMSADLPPLYFAPLWPGFRLVLHNKARYCSTCKREQTRPNARQNKLPMQSDAIFSRARYSKKSLIHGKDAVEHLEHCKRNNNRLFLRQGHCIVWVPQSIWCYGDIQKRKMSKAQ